MSELEVSATRRWWTPTGGREGRGTVGGGGEGEEGRRKGLAVVAVGGGGQWLRGEA